MFDWQMRRFGIACVADVSGAEGRGVGGQNNVF